MENIDENNEDKETETNYDKIRSYVKNEISEVPIVEGDKIRCPDCGKLVTKKTLKYSHKNQCKKTNLNNNQIDNSQIDNNPTTIKTNIKPHKYSHIFF